MKLHTFNTAYTTRVIAEEFDTALRLAQESGFSPTYNFAYEVEDISDYLIDLDFWERVNLFVSERNNTDSRYIAVAKLCGFIIQTSHTQIEWTERGLEVWRACQLWNESKDQLAILGMPHIEDTYGQDLHKMAVEYWTKVRVKTLKKLQIKEYS